MPNKLEPSLVRRYINKLSSQLIIMIVGLLTAGLVPRALGPSMYGSFHFLTDFFMKLKNFFDMGSSIWFFTKVSKQPKEKLTYLFYGGILFIITALILGFTIFVFSFGLMNYVWPDQQVKFIFMALIFVLLTFFVDIFTKIMDAHALTVPFQWMRVVVRCIFVGILLMIYMNGFLTLPIYFFYQYGFLILILIGSIFIGMKNDLWSNFLNDFTTIFSLFKKFWKEFYEYVHPLFFYSLMALIIGVLDRWMLQFFSGGEQQGFFSLAYQLSQLCFLFTSSLTPLLMREFSVASEANNRKKMRELFNRYIPLLYSITAFFSCFALVQSKSLIILFGGDMYLGSMVPMMLMVLYPIHQTYGQLSSSVFYATGQTKLYRNIGVFMMFFGLIVSFFLLAPKEYYGLDLGALGLSMKMVALQFISVNIGLFFNSKYLSLNLFRYWMHQIGVLIIFLIVAFFASIVVGQLTQPVILTFITSGIVYTLSMFVLIFLFPGIVGFKKEDAKKLLQRFLGV
ncbi:MAG: oligosaccharide flippase family protein [Candidatus Marinamargulisbacteria bacterium]